MSDPYLRNISHQQALAAVRRFADIILNGGEYQPVGHDDLDDLMRSSLGAWGLRTRVMMDGRLTSADVEMTRQDRAPDPARVDDDREHLEVARRAREARPVGRTARQEPPR